MTATPDRQELTGIGVGRGSAVGPLAVMAPPPALPADEPSPEDPAAAEAAVRDALAEVASDLRNRAERAGTTALRQMLEAASVMATDPALAAEAVRLVHDGTGPATALDRAVEQFAALFAAAGGALAERATDLRSVRHRAVARILSLPEPGLAPLTEPSIVAAEDLSPADTASLDLDLVAGIVTELGGPTSHTAIIAGQLGLPCLVRTPGATTVPGRTTVLLDAARGTLVVSPEQDEIERAHHRRAAADAIAEAHSGPGTTADGHRVGLLANIGNASDAARAATTPAEGVGLFRTEMLFLDRQSAPMVAEQVAVYREVVQAFEGRKVVIRTLDAGADKPLAFAEQAGEENPALGVRGYRLTRTLPELLVDQLTALGQVISELPQERRGDVQVMAPMVSTPAEARDFAARARAVGIVTTGVMVEVPAAALRARDLLAEVDFVSMGTNDLAQYTMATDRLRGELVDLLDPWQPAVLDLIAATARAGADLGKPVGVCGESAADPLMALVLTGLGVTSLSMAPPAMPAVHFALRAHTLSQCRAAAADARAASDATAARRAVLDLVSNDVRETLGI